MLTQNDIKLIEFYFENAESKVNDAILLYENNSYRTASTCLYYACFYSATALLIYSKIKNVKSHSGTLQMLSLHFIKTNKLPECFASHFSELMNRRHDADYAMQTIITRNEIEEYIPLTEKFIIEIKKLIEL